MPDSSHLVQRAADDPHLSVKVELLRMSALYNEGDTVRAAAAMSEQGVDCVHYPRGRRHHRAVAKGARDLPLGRHFHWHQQRLPRHGRRHHGRHGRRSVATGSVPLEETTVRSKTIAVIVDGEDRDIALVDVALSKERFVATRAIWDMNTIYEVFLTRAERRPSACRPSGRGCKRYR